MGIDRIGKGGGVPPATPAETTKPSAAGSVERTFEAHVEKPNATAPAERAASSPLVQLRAGQIDVEQYVDLKVDEATRNLGGLTATERDAIRSMVRDQVATDPTLVDLVRQAAGRAPRAPDE